MPNKEIEKIERIAKIRKSSRWYYHAITSSPDRFLKIVQEGLLCKNILGYSRTKNGYNGNYYISLSKDIKAPLEESGYLQYIEEYPMLMIADIKAIKCFKTNCNTIFTNTIIPFRTSGYKDEYQVFNKIDSSKFIGIEAKAYDWSIQEKISELKNLRDIILVMRKSGISLPIYDYSREEDGIIHEVDQEKYLEFSKRYIG